MFNYFEIKFEIIPSLKKVTPWAVVVSTEDSLPVHPIQSQTT